VTLFTEAGFVPLPLGPFAPVRTSRWMVAQSSRCFEGHFEGAPILPGVAHLALALRACGEEASGPRVLTGLKDVRFKRPLGPGDEVEVALAEGSEPSSVRFEIRAHGEPASVGLLLFAAAGASHGR
jgi:Polyketide synthase dehydratase